jgi:hypothetical protein
LQTATVICQAADAVQQASEDDIGAIQKAESRLKHAVALVKAMLTVHEQSVPAKLTETIVGLHGQALLALSDMPAAQEAVAKLCLDYWNLNAPNAINVTIQMVRIASSCLRDYHHTSIATHAHWTNRMHAGPVVSDSL